MSMMCHAMMKKRKKVIVIARKGRYFYHVNIKMHRKPKVPRDEKKFENADW